MKTFRQQMLKVILERYRNNDVERHQQLLNEVTTPAAETVITYIRQWPSPSRNQAVARLLECDRWNDKGELVLERDFKGKPYKCVLPMKLAYDSYMFGDQRKQVWPMYNFPSALKKIPENITPDWQEELRHLFYDINKMPLKAAKLVNLGYQVKMYGLNNPHTFVNWDRQVSEFEAAQKAIDEYVAGKKGLEYLQTKNLQDPKHAQEMSKVLSDILAKADEAVEPCIQVIKEADRKLYARQDATYARNNVKSLAGFFKKYEADAPEILTPVSNMINFVEEQNK